ncbi:MAG: twin-arginine translocase TatA/TatE family subunit [Ammonifex sp.]|jgi:sec-independent protein translocase protein TatA|nr:MAG: twin-arginine translocase TatA/TatE family subunit [Ammonifex sp.]
MIPRIGPTELILILGLVLVVFGPKRLPEVGRSLGKTLREFRKSTRETDEPIELASAETTDQNGQPAKS